MAWALACIGGCDRAQIIQRDRDAGPSFDAFVAPVDAFVGPPRATIPPSPGGTDSEGPEVVYVLREPVLNQTGGLWERIGWDLDGRCSDPPRGDAGLAGMDAGLFADWDIECLPRRPDMAPPIVDGELCRDNAYGLALSPGLAAVGIDVQADVRALMAEGRFAFLVRIRGWNGEPDDPRVTADVFATVAGTPMGGREGDPLLWDGTDTFSISEESLAAPPLPMDQSILHDELGYVAGGVFVMHLPERAEFEFSTRSSVLRTRIPDATITGRIDAASP